MVAHCLGHKFQDWRRMHAESFARQRHLLGIYPKRFSVRYTRMLKETQNPTAFISRVRASWSRSPSSLEEKFHVSFFWHHTKETMSWQSFSGFTAVNCLSPCKSRNGDACEHFSALARLGKKLIRIRSSHGVLVTSAMRVFKLL